jgi:hypothetical protein
VAQVSSDLVCDFGMPRPDQVAAAHRGALGAWSATAAFAFQLPRAILEEAMMIMPSLRLLLLSDGYGHSNESMKPTLLFLLSTVALLLGSGTVRSQIGPASAIPRPLAADGIASHYPGDAGIERDPQVVFVENFEEDSLETLWKRWETVGDRSGQSFSADVPSGSAGKRSLLMEREKGSGAQLYRRLKNKEGGWGYERLFARYYVKFDPECGEIHHFVLSRR